MSSKSRKHSQKPRRSGQHPDGDEGEAALRAAAAKAVSAQSNDPLEDFIETPKGKSKLQQYFMIFLLIFLLIVFVVPFALQSSFMSNPGDELLMTWNHPEDGRQELSAQEFMNTKRELAKFRGFLGTRDVDDLDTARFIIFDRIARDAGIEISDEDLRSYLEGIIAQVGGVEQYQGIVRSRYDGTVQRFEAMLRRELRQGRYQQLLAELGALPNPADYQEMWDEQHLEYAFDYVELEVESLHDEVLAMVPDDEGEGGLQEWFDALPEWERNQFRDPELFAAELAYYPSGTEPPAALLERFPAPEDADAEARAREYFNATMTSRFMLDLDEDADPTTPRFPTFEEVEEDALREAPVYFAFQAWNEELQERVQNGEEIDLEAEAESLGLAYVGAEDPISREDWAELDDLGGLRLASLVNRTAAGSLATTPVYEKGGMIVLRVTEKVEATMPPFDEIRDEVAELWVEKRASDVAVERLAALRKELVGGDDAEGEEAEASSSTVDLVDFQNAAEAAGYTVQRRDWLDRRAGATDDENWDSEAHRFIRGRAALYDLEEGGLSQPAANAAKTHAYLVRSNGSRKMDIAGLKPAEYQRYRRQSQQEAMARIGGADGLASRDELVRLYDLNLIGSEPTEDFEEEVPQ